MATKKKTPVKSPKKTPTPKKAPVKKVPKKKTPKKAKVNKKTHVVLVLDKSSSMGPLQEQTIKSVNEQIDTIKNSSKGIETTITFVQFNDRVQEKFFCEPIEKLQILTKDDYVPSGMTAMLDAIGLTVAKLKGLPDINDPETAVLFVVITDGEENSSRTYTKNSIAELVTELAGTNRWTFSVLGANIDLNKLSDDLKIAKSNMAVFTASAQGTHVATQSTNSSYGKYFGSRLKSSNLVGAGLQRGFYNDKSEDILDVTDKTDANVVVNLPKIVINK
jgi:hypothetical protein